MMPWVRDGEPEPGAVLGTAEVGSRCRTGDRRGREPAMAAGRARERPVKRLTFPGMRVARRCGQIPEGFPIRG